MVRTARKGRQGQKPAPGSSAPRQAPRRHPPASFGGPARTLLGDGERIVQIAAPREQTMTLAARFALLEQQRDQKAAARSKVGGGSGKGGGGGKGRANLGARGAAGSAGLGVRGRVAKPVTGKNKNKVRCGA